MKMIGSKIKICMLTPEPFSPIGGAESLIYELFQAISKKGHEISVVCAPSDDEGVNKKKSITIYPIMEFKGSKIMRSMRHVHYSVQFLKIIFSFHKMLKQQEFDIIHVHFAFPAGTVGLIGKLFNIPIIVTSHGMDIQKDKDAGYGFRLNKVYAFITWLTLKLIDYHVVVSKSMIKDAIGAGSTLSKIRVVYNGIDLDKISSFGGTDILQRYKITKDNFIFLYLGRLHPKKCPDDLVKAFPKVVKKVPNARLIFAGKGEEETKLKKLVTNLNLEEKVIFTGFVSDDDKWDVLKNCDVFVLPSVVEAFGITVIEAMACGKPVIATNVGPFPEIISDGETGFLVPLHSPNELADAMIELALNEDKRIKMGEMATKDVKKRFDINKIADDYLKIYEELIKGRK